MRTTTFVLSLLSITSILTTGAALVNHPILHVAIQKGTKRTREDNNAAIPRIILAQSHLSAISNDSIDHNGDPTRQHLPEDEQRRKTIFGGAVSSLPFIFGNKKANAAASTTTTTTTTTSIEEDDLKPVADFPMRRLRLPKGGMGREYIIIQLYIQGKGPFDFMVDSGLTTELITPHLQQVLNLNKSAGVTKQGLSAGATSQTQSLVELNDVSLCCGTFSSGQSFFPLKSPLHAIVTNFPQEHMDPEHDPVEGMIGMEVLEQFDVDFDFPAGRLRLWKPHTVERVAKKAGMVTIDAVVVNETRLLGFRVVSSSAPRDDSRTSIVAQPFLGVVDCGASFSVVNWAAAPLLGLPPQNDGAYKKSPMVTGLGVDGLPQLLPTSTVGLSYCGNVSSKDKSTTMSFEAPPNDWKPWKPISLAIGDLPVFSKLLGDGRTPYRGPAGIIGLDILSQRRLILETSSSRQRRIYVVFSVVDGFIPRAETLAKKSKMNHQHRSEQSTSSGPKHNEKKRFYHHYQLTEMQLGQFDLPFHGSGTSGSKEALDEKPEPQQTRGIGSLKVEHLVNLDAEDAAHHHTPMPKCLWDLGK
ncbi:hypothetical protein ACHAXR_012431 [Thalassiosira sp. AJA248-18]